MTAQRQSGPKEIPLSPERVAEIAEIMRGVLAEQPKRRNWQFWVALILSPILGALTFFVAQQLDLQHVKDKIGEHDRAIEKIEHHLEDSDAKADRTRERIEDKLDRLTQLVTPRK